MRKYTLEVCCGSVDDVLEAKRGGADRVELNSSLFQGGLTPSIGALRRVRQLTGIPVMAMVRPRQGGFCYSENEYRAALYDAQAMLDNGADGIVFGFLNSDGTVDKARTREIARLAGKKTKVFHRAIDVTPDWKRALSDLIDAGVDRVLTSGQAPNAFYGMDVIRQMIEFAHGAIEILPGAGIKLRNVDQILSGTGCDQIHLGQFRKVSDRSTAGNPEIFFGGALYPPEDRYDLTDGDYIGQMRKHLI